jgi:hypothetical protein
MREKYENYESPTTDVVARTIIMAAIGAFLVTQLAACTAGAGGFVLGLEGIQQKYNERIRILEQVSNQGQGRPMDDYTAGERRALSAAIRRASK